MRQPWLRLLVLVQTAGSIVRCQSDDQEAELEDSDPTGDVDFADALETLTRLIKIRGALQGALFETEGEAEEAAEAAGPDAEVAGSGGGGGGPAETGGGEAEPVPAVSAPTDMPLTEQIHLQLDAQDLEAVQVREPEIKAWLRPLFAALPRTSHQRISMASSRYLLHRYFASQHGWTVHGLGIDTLTEAADGGTWLGTALRHASGETDLVETAFVAATVEHLIAKETHGRLAQAFGYLDLDMQAPLSREEAGVGVDLFMLLHTSNADEGPLTAAAIKEARERPNPSWKQVKEWVHRQVSGKLDGQSFHTLVGVVHRLTEKYSGWADRECRYFEAVFLELENGHTGRIPLMSFYSAALNGSAHFVESKEYLRETGCLDESIPDQPQVLMANYLATPGNCIDVSKHYSVCCMDSCLEVLNHVERSVAAPSTTPKSILDALRRLPAAAPKGRERSEVLSRRLEEMAASHDGQVRLHSRLFKQWLHHAFPRECAFPPVSDRARTTKLSPTELTRGLRMSDQAMKAVISECKPTLGPLEPTWAQDDHLILQAPSGLEQAPLLEMGVIRAVAACVLALMVWRSCLS